ncbi:hypothetical protein ACFQ1S_17280 [Kibdelosporangium lantanae]|uniref:Transposase n=1 Tax=Kibdelosporangium lantanae TaxID=1497396 RepID=A0ABW3MC55_9PSEU
MIVSLLYHVTRNLLTIPGALLRRETNRDAELLLLKHENTILHRQLGKRFPASHGSKARSASVSAHHQARTCSN